MIVRGETHCSHGVILCINICVLLYHVNCALTSRRAGRSNIIDQAKPVSPKKYPGGKPKKWEHSDGVRNFQQEVWARRAGEEILILAVKRENYRESGTAWRAEHERSHERVDADVDTKLLTILVHDTCSRSLVHDHWFMIGCSLWTVRCNRSPTQGFTT